jgi:hypothetical protein
LMSTKLILLETVSIAELWVAPTRSVKAPLKVRTSGGPGM